MSSEDDYAERNMYLTADVVSGSVSTKLNIIVKLIQSQISLDVFIKVSTISRNSSADQQLVTVQFHYLHEKNNNIRNRGSKGNMVCGGNKPYLRRA